MAQLPVSTINACERKDLPANSKTIHASDINFVLHIKLPEYIKCNHKLFEIREVCEDSHPVEFSTCECLHPAWVDISFTELNTDVGHHEYMLRFVEQYSCEEFKLYFSYIVQNDNPERPYIYMKDKEELDEGELSCEEKYSVRI